MALRRLAITALIAASVFATVLVAIVLYLVFADLGRYKTQIEAFVSQQTGRPFTIEGPLKLKVLPSISVAAEGVRLANAKWGSQPAMVQIGRFATKVSVWSLIAGPPRIQLLELRDVSVLLEKNTSGEGNWVLGGKTETEKKASSPDTGATAVPVVVEGVNLSNVRITYREPGKADRVAEVETLVVNPGAAGLLAISEKGLIDGYATNFTGEVGPLDALFSGTNV